MAENSAVWRLLGVMFEDALDVLEEAEVEHLVGLVEDDEATRVEDQRRALGEVHHPADRADDDVPAGAQLRLLRADRRAAEDGDDIDALAPAVRPQRLGDLDAQLARRREDERLDLRDVGVDVLQDRQSERGRLARAGLRLTDDVAPSTSAGSPAPGSHWASCTRRPAAKSSALSESPRSAKAVTSAAGYEVEAHAVI